VIGYVSVIIPVYNDQTGIDACLAALRTQTYPRDCYEVIIVDNASTPPIRIDKIFSDFARIVICQTPGAYAARNAGIAVARSAILAFTDADCIPDNHWISAGVEALYREKERCIIGGEVMLSLSKRPTTIEQYQYLTGFMQRENIEHLGFTVTANLFATRSQVEHIGLFDQKLLSGGDREWSWRAAQAGFAVKYVSEAIVHTSPRTSLASAIRQARRVAGGRYMLRETNQNTVHLQHLRSHRNAWASVQWIIGHPKLSLIDRFWVLGVATLLKVTHALEMVRLRLGGQPSR
jgi:glycosyltransferase involved in cell wall biosynthesis